MIFLYKYGLYEVLLSFCYSYMTRTQNSGHHSMQPCWKMRGYKMGNKPDIRQGSRTVDITVLCSISSWRVYKMENKLVGTCWTSVLASQCQSDIDDLSWLYKHKLSYMKWYIGNVLMEICWDLFICWERSGFCPNILLFNILQCITHQSIIQEDDRLLDYCWKWH